jgi:hypothetical protein
VTEFPALGVQILPDDDTVYSIGNHDPLTQTDSSRPLGSLAGAEAMVTDGSQACRDGRAMLLPLAPTALDTRAMADAAVVFPDGTAHVHALQGNEECRAAQDQVVRFNALAAAAAPDTTKADHGQVARLQNLQEQRETGVLCQEEYDAMRAEIIASL